jgi:hypothetical protein
MYKNNYNFFILVDLCDKFLNYLLCLNIIRITLFMFLFFYFNLINISIQN